MIKPFGLINQSNFFLYNDRSLVLVDGQNGMYFTSIDQNISSKEIKKIKEIGKNGGNYQVSKIDLFLTSPWEHAIHQRGYDTQYKKIYSSSLNPYYPQRLIKVLVKRHTLLRQHLLNNEIVSSVNLSQLINQIVDIVDLNTNTLS